MEIHHNRSWAQVILMLEQSLKPKDRLLAMLKYSRPVGTNKSKRAFVIERRLTEAEVEAKDKYREIQWLKAMEDRKTMIRKKMEAGSRAASALSAKRSAAMRRSSDLPEIPVENEQNHAIQSE